MLSRDDILKAFDRINVWSRGSERAPHKPLLVLFALGQLSRGGPKLIAFRDLAPKLTELLKEFGPTRQSYLAEFSIDLRERKLIGIEVAAPLDQLLVAFVLGIRNRIQKLLVAPNTTDTFRRASSFPSTAAGVFRTRFGRCGAFQLDRMLPSVTEVVLVRELDSLPSAGNDLAELHFAFVDHVDSHVAIHGVRDAVLPLADLEAVQFRKNIIVTVEWHTTVVRLIFFHKIDERPQSVPFLRNTSLAPLRFRSPSMPG